MRVHISAKRSDVNTRKGEAEGRAASLQRREVNVTVGIAAFIVGAIVYRDTDRQTDEHTHGQIDQSHNLLQFTSFHWRR